MELLGDIKALIGGLDPEQGMELLEAVQTPAFAIKDMHILHQYVHHWREQKILWSDARGRKGKQYTFLDYVWLKMVERLRDFGMPFETIRAFKEGVQVPIPFAQFQDIALEALNEAQLKKYLNQLPKAYRESFEEMLKIDPKEVEQAGDWNADFFTLLLLGVLIQKTHLAFLIDRNGEVVPFVGNNTSGFFEHPTAREFFKNSYMSVSVTEIIQEIIAEQDMDFLLERVEVISPDERQVIDLIRKGALSKLTIRFNTDYSIELIEATRMESVDVTSRFIDIITHRGYQDIEFKTQQGKVVQFSNTTKYKPGMTGS